MFFIGMLFIGTEETILDVSHLIRNLGNRLGGLLSVPAFRDGEDYW